MMIARWRIEARFGHKQNCYRYVEALERGNRVASRLDAG